MGTEISRIKEITSRVPNMFNWWYLKELMPSLFNLFILMNSKELDRNQTCKTRYYEDYALNGGKLNE